MLFSEVTLPGRGIPRLDRYIAPGE